MLAFVFFSRTGRAGDAASQAQSGNSLRINVVESSEDLHESLQDRLPLYFGASRAEGLTIIVDDAAKYQQIDGFGASLTDSSA